MYSCPTSTFGTFLINCAEHTFYIQDLEIEAEDMSEIGDQETDHGIVLLCFFLDKVGIRSFAPTNFMGICSSPIPHAPGNY
jgi:hypothetical protein